VVLAESRKVLWASRGLLIAETHQGLVCAKAGIDRCNSGPQSDEELACLLPVDSDASAQRLRDRLRDLSRREVAVLINDSQGRPFRRGRLPAYPGRAP
jgi:coenzyme F420-0:L-glutamate ligase/coenzyme F420-1:gamma-L-glutamate ligase